MKECFMHNSKKAHSRNLPVSGIFLLALLSFLWGSSWPFVKIALAEVPLWTFRSLCVVCSVLFLVVLAKTSGQKLRLPRKELGPLFLVSLLNITGWIVLSAYGVSHMNAGRAVIIGFTMPIWASILGIFILHERLIFGRVLGMALGMAGLAILFGPEIKTLGSAPIGPLFMLGSAVSWGLGTVFIRYFNWTTYTASFTAWQFILGGIPVVVGALILESFSAISQLSVEGALAAAYVALLCMPLGWWAWFKVITLLPTSVAALGTIAAPVIGVFSSAIVLEEPLGFQEIAAMLCVVVALTIVLIGPSSEQSD